MKLTNDKDEKANKKHFKKDGKVCCRNFNSKHGCHNPNCKFSHHCAITGVANRSMFDKDQTNE
jgi:hypothetical protein